MKQPLPTKTETLKETRHYEVNVRLALFFVLFVFQ